MNTDRYYNKLENFFHVFIFVPLKHDFMYIEKTCLHRWRSKLSSSAPPATKKNWTWTPASWKNPQKGHVTLPKFNIAPEKLPSQKVSSLPTTIVQGLCKLRGCIILQLCFQGIFVLPLLPLLNIICVTSPRIWICLTKNDVRGRHVRHVKGSQGWKQTNHWTNFGPCKAWICILAPAELNVS